MESTFYPYLGALGWTGLFLLIGTIIRAKVKFFQTFLFPASLIGGIIGFFVLNAGWLGIPSSTGWKTITPVTFSTITFHLFAFGFVGIGLLQAKSGTSGKGRGPRRVVDRAHLRVALLGAGDGRQGDVRCVEAALRRRFFHRQRLPARRRLYAGPRPDAGVRQHLGKPLIRSATR